MKYFFESALDGTSADSIALLSSSKYMVNTEQLQFECLGWWQLESRKTCCCNLEVYLAVTCLLQSAMVWNAEYP